MRIIDGESARNKILDAIWFTAQNFRFARKSSELRIYLTAYGAALNDALKAIDSEETVSTIIGDNNLHKLSVKALKYHV